MAGVADQWVYAVMFYDWEDAEVLGVYARLEDAEEHVRAAAKKGDDSLVIEKHEVLGAFPGLASGRAYSMVSRAKGWHSWTVDGPTLPLRPLPPGPWPRIASSAAISVKSPPSPGDSCQPRPDGA